MKNISTGRIVWGLALIAAGTVFALNILGITKINIFFDGWWTFFIIVPSTVSLFRERDKFSSLIWLVIGVALLLSAQGILDLTAFWQLLIPVGMILIGLKILLSSSFRRKAGAEWTELKSNVEGVANATATFTARRLDFAGQSFSGASLDAVFGSISLDLSQARIEKDALITASVVFAGIDIRVPDYVEVKVDSSVLFGAVSDKREKMAGTDVGSDRPVTLYIEANCLFGGVEIK
ncbi:MAG: LiaF-related protein [Bacillota bacterium]|nr:LiaF-related protein [Bacillota bacterium]